MSPAAEPLITEEDPHVTIDKMMEEDDRKAEAAAGTYLMFQFVNGPTSIIYRRVFSNPPPHPLAVQAILQDQLDQLKAATALDVEARMMQGVQMAQQQMEAALVCKHCGKKQPQETVNLIMQGKLAFCHKCHQKMG